MKASIKPLATKQPLPPRHNDFVYLGCYLASIARCRTSWSSDYGVVSNDLNHSGYSLSYILPDWCAFVKAQKIVTYALFFWCWELCKSYSLVKRYSKYRRPLCFGYRPSPRCEATLTEVKIPTRKKDLMVYSMNRVISWPQSVRLRQTALFFRKYNIFAQ